MAEYPEQLSRVKRYLAKIQTHDRSPVDYDDDMWMFFQGCWHLKDWIKNDLSVAESVRSVIEDEVKHYPDLMICADLANGAKHLRLTKPARVGAKHHHKNYNLTSGGPSRVDYFVDRGDGTTVDGVQLALACIAAWEEILKKYGL